MISERSAGVRVLIGFKFSKLFLRPKINHLFR
nr:MAG TPA: hypothetical protein [Caudoviricetes sp.]